MKRLLCCTVAYMLPLFLRTKNKQRFSILTYHRVLPQFDYMRPLETTQENFEWQMDLISKYCNPLSLSEALRLLADDALPPRAVCVTFDDGYSDNETTALPILERLGISATVFVAVGFLNAGRMWNDTIVEVLRSARGHSLDLREIGLREYSLVSQQMRCESAGMIINEVKHWPNERRISVVEAISCIEVDGELPDNLMMVDAQVCHMNSCGIEIGAHTMTHPILSAVQFDQAKHEIVESKTALESLLGKPVRSFAYPNGKPEVDYTSQHRDCVEASGYECAVSTRWGAVSKGSDPFQLPRFTPWDKTPLRFLARLLLNFRNPA
jgi:peptidoglycan/xylan/chitin deacetylase (PgdA/CDA1 family)